MLIKGAISSDKTQKLIDAYVKLLNTGVSSSKILVILQNSNKKNKFIQSTLEKLSVDVIEKLQVYSFFGLVYNTISDNWASIENLIPDKTNTKILPNLTGLEVSQFIMKDIIANIKFEGYNSKKSLLHQLFRRYSLIVQNDLNDKDVKNRSENVLRESFAPDAKKALDEFKRKTLNARALDYLRQSLIFNYIYKKTKYFTEIEYLIVDDADEITPICLDFIKYIKPQLKDAFIAYDEKGSSRSGYLSADKQAGAELEKLFADNPPTQVQPSTALFQDAETIFDNVIEQKNTKLNHFSLNSFSKRAQMLDVGITEIKKLISNGLKPSEITVITPIIDEMLKFGLKEEIKNANIVFLSGSEKIVQNPIVLTTLTILKLCDETLRNDLSEFEVRSILQFLQIPIRHCKNILEKFEKTKKFVDYEFSVDEYNIKYQQFRNLLKNLTNFNKLSEQVFEIYDNLVEVSNYTSEEIVKFNFFIKQLEDFENVFGENLNKFDIINQIENSIIAENPYSTLEIADNDLIVATPQKIIDNQIQTKYQFWFDVSSDEWIKNDTGPLYNAWVFQAGWDKDEYTLQDNIELSKQKTARGLRKLTLCSKEKINAYASLFDGSGIENFGGIEKYLTLGKEIKNIIPTKKFIPREDQKPVLDYKTGQMAISAVPGAGKTTILLELIIRLLSRGINPENIFVLTYMESAARNFRERIQNANQELSELPNISTIHGLALKILKENSNFERLGLNTDFEICDDTQRSRILRELAAKLDIKKAELEDFDRAVSVMKIGGGENTANKTITHLYSNSKITVNHLYSKQALEYAKELRKNMTDAENTLWYYLKNKQMNGIKFRKQSPIGNYIVDFVSFEKNIIIELDGSQHLEHQEIKHDKKRDEFLTKSGYKVLRIYNNDIFENITGVLEFIYSNLTPPTPNPPPQVGSELPLTNSLTPTHHKTTSEKLPDSEQTLLASKNISQECKNIKTHMVIPAPPEGAGKGGGCQKPKPDKKLTKFLHFFDEYNTVLKSNNLIDYDDMLIMSVRLLEENPDICAYYQELCHYIIEDEAQDSSAIQQRLINLLSAKHKNLIRCGDINQAITTTFSNADVEGFRKFINTSGTKVSMDSSQRCTKEVWQLANKLVTNASKKEETKNAFYDIMMRPVEGKNPVSSKAVSPIIFENEFVEKNFILKQIKNVLEKEPKFTIGILLRSNFQVARWTKFIDNAGLKTITRSECLEQKGIFRTIFAVLNIILNPFDNENLATQYAILSELGHYKTNLYQTIKNEQNPIVQLNADDIKNTDLLEFYWDLIYWLNFSSLAPEELAIKIGLYYYSSEIEKSNVYLISTLIKRLGMSYKKFSTLLERLGELSKKPNLSGFKFFSEEESADKDFLSGKIQIMTLHKSKGDEFDVVFLPEMAEKSLPLDFKNITLKKNARFMESVRELNPNYKQKTDDELKEFLLAENLRLFYVAITRAKKKLYITANKSAKFSKTPEPSTIFKDLGVS